ncbi:uncharacterized protein LOC113282298 [Papaver somniferum]|uniref:uncharacterized protein LOC113282298 n=1 Tax=Papaver somniferum TaxID=3469 RepID=UPI000E6F5CEC|nr:uncharacterized protein LOC113282298 [Papaver somniferum]XP_026387068.1 uncharacterized protein LOC113282298 [Papaver somniferum]
MEMESSLRMVPCKYLAGTISVQYRLRRNPNSHSRKDLTIQDTDQYHNLALTATFIAPKGNGAIQFSRTVKDWSYLNETVVFVIHVIRILQVKIGFWIICSGVSLPRVIKPNQPENM